jgi:hypothetical protein
MADDERSGRRRSIVLWALAIALMLGAAAYQRTTGPTYPLPGEYTVADKTYGYRLVRRGHSAEDTEVRVAASDGDDGLLVYRRYPTDDEFVVDPLVAGEDELIGHLPAQPAAGKLEYYVIVRGSGEEARLPPAQSGNAVIRFKNSVPAVFLIPHILFMFVGVLLAMRAGLGALFGAAGMRRLAWVTLGTLTVGGLVLGPIVQKYAFGELWTGVPYGWDLTDNKTLIMWLAWLMAALVVRRRAGGDAVGLGRARMAVIVAAVVTVAAYLIPHSFRGSQLDYEQFDEGMPAEEAVGLGR